LPMQCTFAVGIPHFAASGNILIYLGMLCYLFFSYINNLIRLSEWGDSSSLLDWLSAFMEKKLKHLARRPSNRSTNVGVVPSLDKLLSRLEATVERISNISTIIEKGRSGFKVLVPLATEFRSSFPWEIIWMLFGIAASGVRVFAQSSGLVLCIVITFILMTFGAKVIFSVKKKSII
jgi:hypothetical protein